MKYANSFVLVAAVASALLTGCRHDSDPAPAGYFGPTDSMTQVVEAINANNQRISTLWAKGYFEATVVDSRKREQFVNGDAVLLHRKPTELRLVGKGAVGALFELGTTAEQYWMIVNPEVDTMWWGTYDRIEHADTSLIPIRPDLLTEVLAVGQIPSDFLRPPTPVFRFNNDADAYMLLWNVPSPSRWLAQKEVWYDRQTKLPKLVLLFDDNGRIVLRAYLSDHKPVELDDSDNQAPPPMLATKYKLFFPDSGSRMTLDFSTVRLTRNGVPREGSIRFPGTASSGVSNIVQVDAENRR